MTRALCLCLCLLLAACAPFPKVDAPASKTALKTPGLLTSTELAAATVTAPPPVDPLAAQTRALNARANALRAQQ
jgi:hypothetical protein